MQAGQAKGLFAPVNKSQKPKSPRKQKDELICKLDLLNESLSEAYRKDWTAAIPPKLNGMTSPIQINMVIARRFPWGRVNGIMAALGRPARSIRQELLHALVTPVSLLVNACTLGVVLYAVLGPKASDGQENVAMLLLVPPFLLTPLLVLVWPVGVAIAFRAAIRGKRLEYVNSERTGSSGYGYRMTRESYRDVELDNVDRRDSAMGGLRAYRVWIFLLMFGVSLYGSILIIAPLIMILHAWISY